MVEIKGKEREREERKRKGKEWKKNIGARNWRPTSSSVPHEPEADPHGSFLRSNREVCQIANSRQTDNGRSIITIGMELEFVVIGIPQALLAERSVFEIVRDGLQNLFQTGGISVQTEVFLQNSLQQPDRSRFIVMDEKSCDVVISDEAMGTSTVGHAVEICTPIMRFGSWNWLIPTVFEYLKVNFDCRFNKTTGLHVHVGCGSGWSLEDLKAIAKAVVIFESTLDHLHPPHRRPQHNWCISSNRRSENLGSRTKLDAVRMLEEAETLQDLLNLIGSHKFHKYNFNSVNTYGTVEFRQADAAINMDDAVKWINLIVKFVQAAVNTKNEDFEAWAGCEDPFICCPRDSFELFGVPWVGQMETGGVQAWLDEDCAAASSSSQWGIEEESAQEGEADNFCGAEGFTCSESGVSWPLVFMLFSLSFFDIIPYILG